MHMHDTEKLIYALYVIGHAYVHAFYAKETCILEIIACVCACVCVLEHFEVG